MEVFYHHLYEYEKGLRNLILHNTKKENRELIEKRLTDSKINFIIYNISGDKINVFFGDGYCVDVIKSINKVSLTEYTDEEDFILGIMLGYDRLKQCQRYMKRKFAKDIVETLIG